MSGWIGDAPYDMDATARDRYRQQFGRFAGRAFCLAILSASPPSIAIISPTSLSRVKAYHRHPRPCPAVAQVMNVRPSLGRFFSISRTQSSIRVV